jgi:hypothetical protein
VTAFYFSRRKKKLDNRYEQDTLLQNISISLVRYADYITVRVRYLRFVVETDLELDAIMNIRLRYSISKTEVLTQTSGNRTVA